MSVMKKTWIQILENKPTLSLTEFDSLFEDIDELLNSMVSEDLSISLMKDIYDDVIEDYLSTDETKNVWKDLPIFVSSFKLRDKRIFNLIKLKILQYLGFYKRILSDGGVARTVLTHRSYTDNNESSGTNRSQYSETPQVDVNEGTIPTFDETLDYLSNVSKNNDEIESERTGESDLSVTSKSWDEELKNLNMLFYNAICEYISKIPEIIYNYYSLDSYPVPELMCKSIEYYKALRDIYERR